MILTAQNSQPTAGAIVYKTALDNRLSPGAPRNTELIATCPWCGRTFAPRQTGGHDQQFCRPACRRALHAAARRWALTELAAGRLRLNAIKAGLPATCALDTAA